MKGEELQIRTKRFAVRVVKLVRSLHADMAVSIIAKQLLRCGTSVAANYRAACRSKSAKDFINKIAIVVEEADETMFWLELLVETGLVKQELVADLYQEAKEIAAIMAASKSSAAKNAQRK